MDDRENVWFRCCSVLDVETTVKDVRNPFGMISGGWLRLSAVLKPIICLYPSGLSASLFGCLEPEDNENDPRIKISPDLDKEIANGEPIWCIEIFRNYSKYQGVSYGLVLRKREGGQSYNRVGFLELRKQNQYGWLFKDGAKRQNITII